MVKDIIRIRNRFYVLATSSLADERRRVLKYGETFGVFNRLGDIERLGLGEQGLYHRDMRHLSRYVLRLGGNAPQMLHAAVREDNALLMADMMNVDIVRGDRIVVPRGSLHIFRSKFLWHDACFEHFRIANYSLDPVETMLSLLFEADFADIFEVRGTPKREPATRFPPNLGRDCVGFRSEGSDGNQRCTTIHLSPVPAQMTEQQASFVVSLASRDEMSIYVTVSCHASASSDEKTFNVALQDKVHSLEEVRRDHCRISTSNPQFNAWLSRSEADLQMMTEGNPEGDYPYAGVPWFSTIFGRDGIITARECLAFAPKMARSVLLLLARTQATEINPEQEAEPGKIIHEMRHGEMANTKEVPFGRYYGSIDATPLFVVLAGSYLRRTGDRELLRTIWPNILAALNWMDTYGDADRDGFVEYEAKGPNGLTQQGWKDSNDSIFYGDGTLAQPPIALCEVQGYVYAAKRAAAEIAGLLGNPARAASCRAEAEALREKFERQFWSEELGMYAIALDGQKVRCEIKASNSGHCLFAGIASRERAARVMNSLVGPELFCGWGIRTLGSREARYNPMAYHNGTVWPHDNALIARGFANYGFREAVLTILDGLFEASLFTDLHRLPELLCGFHRRKDGEGPTLYPVACSPQSWSSGAVYLLLEACLGMEVSSPEAQINFHSPSLPKAIEELRIENLRVNEAAADLLLWRAPDGSIRIENTRTESKIAVVVEA